MSPGFPHLIRPRNLIAMLVACLFAAPAWSGLDQARVEPGARPGNYERILVEPVEVEFHPRWKPRRTGSRLPLSERERERIRDDVAEAFDKAFRQELSSNGYQLVSETGPDVLRLTPRLVDVTVNVIDDRPPFPAHTLISDGDRFTLVAELRDAESDQLVATVKDSERRHGFDGVYRHADRITMRSEAELIFRRLGAGVRDWLEAQQ